MALNLLFKSYNPLKLPPKTTKVNLGVSNLVCRLLLSLRLRVQDKLSSRRPTAPPRGGHNYLFQFKPLLRNIITIYLSVFLLPILCRMIVFSRSQRAILVSKEQT